MVLSPNEELVLESCLWGSGDVHPFDHRTAILIGPNMRAGREFPKRLIDEGCVCLSSVGYDGDVTVYTVRLTRKGYAALKGHWKLQD
jgi:hypothetical protein